MRRGAWHQFGDRSQCLALEQLRLGVGVGVILSPRDLSFRTAVAYAQSYHDLGAAVVIDEQFYVPPFLNTRLRSYPTSDFRRTASRVHRLPEQEISGLCRALHQINEALHTDAIIAPALLYETGHRDIIDMNAKLFLAAKRVGEGLGIPTYATVVLGRSVTSADGPLEAVLSDATSLPADGWYYAFEFDRERIPSSSADVARCCATGLTLACTGKPVLHAYAGPMALLSMGFGATGTGIGPHQNLWQFTRGRWARPQERGGGGEAPARFFSRALWGTIIHPDETTQLPLEVQNQVLTESPFVTPWDRWQANKHFVYVVSKTVSQIAATDDPRVNARAAVDLLQVAISLHGKIASTGMSLRDDANAYQANWRQGMMTVLENHARDYDYLELVR